MFQIGWNIFESEIKLLFHHPDNYRQMDSILWQVFEINFIFVLNHHFCFINLAIYCFPDSVVILTK